MNEMSSYEELFEKVKELQQSLDSCRTFIENSQDLFYRTDLDGRITFISPSVYELSGYTVEEAIGMHMAEEVYLFQEERKDFLAKLRSEGQVTNFEVRLKRKDGSVWWASTNAHFYKDREGNILGVEGITRNITDLKRSNEALEKSEAKFRGVFENKGTATGIYGEDGIIRECNAVFEDLIGYSKTEIIDKKKWSDFVVKEDLDRMLKYHAQRSKDASAPPSQYECRIINKNDEIRNVIVNIGLVDETRIVSLTDITPRKQANEALRESELHLKQAQEVAGVGSWHLNLLEDVLTWSDQIYRMFGVSTQTPLNLTSFLERVHSEDRPAVESAWQAALKGASYDIEHRIMVNAESRWVHERAQITFDNDGSPLDAVGTVLDITERKQAEEALRESKAQLASLGDNIPGGMIYQIETDGDGKTRKFVYVSAGVEKMHEITANAVLEDAGLLYEQISEDQRSLFIEKETNAIKEMKNFSVEACFKLPSGRTRWGMISSAPRRSPDGNILWGGIEIDITDRKKAEKDREQLQERLRKTQRMESIATLAGGIAHQFNNALTIVTGTIELLEMAAHGDKKTESYINNIKTTASRMTQLTAQLLTYARGGKYKAKIISLCDFVRDTLPSIGHTTDPAIHLDTYFADDIFNIEADLTQMQMALSALLMNSVEAMEGKGRIQIDCRNETVTEQIAKGFPGLRPGKYACIKITDDGKGMDKETRDRVFEPFFTTKFQGRGLGMAGVYGFAKSHDGYIMIDSELGKGTTVKIYLPACESLNAGDPLT